MLSIETENAIEKLFEGYKELLLLELEIKNSSSISDNDKKMLIEKIKKNLSQ